MNFIEVIIMFAIITVSYIAGYNHRTESLHEELVKQGHAEYYLDSNNDKQWRIKE